MSCNEELSRASTRLADFQKSTIAHWKFGDVHECTSNRTRLAAIWFEDDGESSRFSSRSFLRFSSRFTITGLSFHGTRWSRQRFRLVTCRGTKKIQADANIRNERMECLSNNFKKSSTQTKLLNWSATSYTKRILKGSLLKASDKSEIWRAASLEVLERLQLLKFSNVNKRS